MASNQSVVCLQIRHQLKQNKIYSFNFSDPALNQRMPFSLIGSDTKIPSNDGASFRGRKYPWGVVNIENEVRTLISSQRLSSQGPELIRDLLLTQEHCDFLTAYKALFIVGLEELKQRTRCSVYEHYRAKRLSFLAAIDEVGHFSSFLNLIKFLSVEHAEYSQ